MKIKTTIFVLLLCARVSFTVAQAETGLYFTVPCAKSQVPSSVVLNKSEKVCTTKQAVLGINDFEFISEIQHAHTVVYFEIRLTDKGFRKLSALLSRIPGSDIALVINKEVVSVIYVKQTELFPLLRFQSFIDKVNEISRVHMQLMREKSS